MSLLKIIYFPNPGLRTIALPVININKKILSIIDDMFETMYCYKGIGLAATQVNINYRIIVIDISNYHNDRLVLINPIFLKKTGIQSIEEGCLSIPSYRANIKRSENITIQALNSNKKLFEISASGLLAACIQHEIDHLNGKLFIDYLSSRKRKIIKQKLQNCNYKEEI